MKKRTVAPDGLVLPVTISTGCALAVASCILIRWWAALHVAGLKSQVLVTDGPYARVRHPLYLGSFLGMLGTGLMLGSLHLGAGFLVLCVAVFAPTIVREERFLRSRFCEAHERYASQVPAILPITTAGQRHGNEETHLSVRRRTFERMSGEALWFLLAYGTPPLFAALHAVSALPLVEAP